MKFLSFTNLPWGHVRSHTTFGLSLLTFIGYKQTNKQTDKKSLYIEEPLRGNEQLNPSGPQKRV